MRSVQPSSIHGAVMAAYDIDLSLEYSDNCDDDAFIHHRMPNTGPYITVTEYVSSGLRLVVQF